MAETTGRPCSSCQPVTDDQVLLAAAQRLGAVHQFATAEPTLVELFREVVSEEPESDDAEAAA